MEFDRITVKELAEGIKSQKFTSEQVVRYFMAKCEEKKEHNAVIEVFDDVVEKAKAMDEKIAKGEEVGLLAGVPFAIKDNILCKGKHASCASNFMKDFVSPYTATVVKKLESEDAIVFARVNMDEFAMGGSCEKSIYGATKNAHDITRVAGGSSGGSAVSVASGMCAFALGTDTGGSIRQPASFNGVVGIKPTYGRVSRYGLVAFASSTDQASPITRTVEDNEFILSIIAGKDTNDTTTIDGKMEDCATKTSYKIGICKQLKEKVATLKNYAKFENAIQEMKKAGFDIVEVDVPHITNSLACYYIISPAEATSNLARFDGVKYTTRNEEAETLEEVYVKSRSEGFGQEVQRRIMLGNYVLSSGYFDAYYKKAKRLQVLLRKEFADAFEVCDAILTPTTPDIAFKIGGKSSPIDMYLEDLFTVPASLAGVPALSIPYAKGENNMPLGIQFIGKEKCEKVLYDIAKKYQKLCKGGNE